MDKPIRVLHVLQRMESAGVQTLLMSIYRNIDRSKVQFDFLVHYKEHQFFDDEVEKLGGHVYKMSVREDFNLIKYCIDLKHFFRQHNEYKIVHGHMPVLGFFYLTAAKKFNIPVRIAHAHTNQHYNNLRGFVSKGMKKLYGINATDFFACSESAGKFFFKESKKFKLLKNAIITENFVFNEDIRNKKREALNLSNKFVVGHVARFAKHKNHTFLIDVFSNIKKLHNESVLLLIGKGELETKIKEKVEKLGLNDDVLFLGIRDDVNEIMQAMDVFVFPSVFEGLGIVNIEAQAAGLLTFCSDGVAKEVNISPMYTKIDLNLGADKWAEIILDKFEHRNPRTDMSEYIIKSGYDVKEIAKNMEEYYLGKYNLS